MEQHSLDLLTDDQKNDLEATLGRLVRGEPLQYVLGNALFMGLELFVGPGVLIPRPETEELVERIVSNGSVPKRIVDIGTGSGCIALALKQAFPDSSVIGLDVSIQALAIAERNAISTKLDVQFVNADVLADSFAIPHGTDLIVSNPPYIRRTEELSLATHVREHEPGLALFVEDGDPLLFYRRIAEQAKVALIPGGAIWFEGHQIFATDVGVMLGDMGYRSVNIAQDLSGNPRFISAIR
ncbi:MAG: peptide chain release factor N(5)-glutamine methyltransferase [Flavobacteriales bacterium]|nr:peptide chain release factor N(5)-glutamine methyltransferase [Flavobacteriales bacterium]MBK6944987.1 peptide chain release factor N(5)-glutamine methyltransferase [Flavobacteriales bacterium]MBK7239335.1 peptide chain release factor N(5)-glutamine methyltransferase [Flavobacteriales bacterium]MBK9535460.1 peptide chain release factor N(5)-glutamine methyltransferase [Flavobacteriales bacterium]MBP9139867.1 peptide chain release factor N(5)-glutamine methyltransferase [Flavobacteriales bact